MQNGFSIMPARSQLFDDRVWSFQTQFSHCRIKDLLHELRQRNVDPANGRLRFSLLQTAGFWGNRAPASIVKLDVGSRF